MEQKIINYSTGITRSPSDILAQDGQLAECINLEVKNGELYPMEVPTNMNINIGEDELVHVHNTSDGEKLFITYGARERDTVDGDDSITETYHALFYHNYSDSYNEAIKMREFSSRPKAVNSIGNTLIVVEDTGMYYFLFKEGSYKYIGNNLPDCTFTVYTEGYLSRYRTENMSGVHIESTILEGNEKIKTVNDQIQGVLNKHFKDVTEGGSFIYPFYIRYALRLFDGSLTKQSTPILIVPNTEYAPLPYVFWDTKVGAWRIDSDTMAMSVKIKMLEDKSLFDDWSDIVKSVDIFISDYYSTRDASGTFDFYGGRGDGTSANYYSLPALMRNYDAAKSTCWCTSFFRYTKEDGTVLYVKGEVNFYELADELKEDENHCFIHKAGGKGYDVYGPGCYKTRTRYKDELENDGVFYFYSSIKINNLTNESTFLYETRNGVPLNWEELRSGEQMTDDYRSHDRLVPQFSHVYNRRLNITGIKRELFKGFNPLQFCQFEDEPINLTIYTHVKTTSGNIIVQSDTVECGSSSRLPYLYYPDPNAFQMDLVYEGLGVKSIHLTESKALNGAYYLYYDQKPDDNITIEQKSISKTDNQYEHLLNKLYTSAIGNPFYFPLKGIVTIGIGEIKAISAFTVPISQGQFGQYPMLAFCSDGNYALAVDDEGFYKSVSPIQNDAVLSNEQITSREGSILAITKKGIMETNGYQMNLLTAQMDGAHFDTSVLPLIETKLDVYQYQFSKTYDSDGFLTYLYGARMAYDYSSNRVFIYNKDKPYSYVMNFDSGTFSKFVMPDDERIVNHVLDYPNTIIQTNTGRLLSLYEKQDVNTLSDRRYGVMVSRPMVLDAPLDLKTVRQLKNMGSFHSESWAKYSLYGSNDGENWVYVVSRHGKPFKYFRIAIYVYGQPKESLSGTAFFFETRRTHRPR